MMNESSLHYPKVALGNAILWLFGWFFGEFPPSQHVNVENETTDVDAGTENVTNYNLKNKFVALDKVFGTIYVKIHDCYQVASVFASAKDGTLTFFDTRNEGYNGPKPMCGLIYNRPHNDMISVMWDDIPGLNHAVISYEHDNCETLAATYQDYYDNAQKNLQF